MATEIRVKSKTVLVTKACAAAGDYAAEDIISENATTGSAWSFSGLFDSNRTAGYITKAIVSCETTGLTPRLRLYLYNASPNSDVTDNAAHDGVVNADMSSGSYQGCIDFPAMADYGANSEAISTPSTYGNLPLWVEAATGADDLYGVLVTLDAITGESAGDDFHISLTLEEHLWA